MSRYDFDGEPYVVIEQESTGVGAFLLGLALGAGAALLFAPRPGAELRGDIGQRARDAREAASELMSDAVDTVSNSLDEVRYAVDDRISATRDVVSRTRRQLGDAVDAGRSAATEARAELERRIAANKAAYAAESRSRAGAQAGSSRDTASS